MAAYAHECIDMLDSLLPGLWKSPLLKGREDGERIYGSLEDEKIYRPSGRYEIRPSSSMRTPASASELFTARFT